MSTDVLSVESDRSRTEEFLRSLVCPKCNVRYPNIHELLTHQAYEQHFSCNQCSLCFWSENALRDHKRKDHRPEPDLECFGCKSHFNRAGLFWKHLESGLCKVIYPSDIARLRDKKLEFAKQLELRKVTLNDIIQHAGSHIKGDDTWASCLGEGTAPAEPIATATPSFPSRPAPISAGNAHPLYYRREDFPGLSTKEKLPATPIVLGEKQGNLWQSRKTVVSQKFHSTPRSYNAVPPPASYDGSGANHSDYSFHESLRNDKTRKIQTTSPEGEPDDTDSSRRIVDPDDPDYNPAVFHNEILEKFVCPYKSCGKKFHNVFTLTQHLRSPAHTGGHISCISCKRNHTTVAGLIFHMETSTKCRIRGSDDFRRALGQITGGILDFHDRLGIFFIDKNSVQDLLELRSESMTESEIKDTEVLDTCAPEQQKH
ncbi:hypothetical protein GQX73_g9124 [Xylaria multiplex]|uniref:C2H2-type domain-containing protein n=1 Tax=Xylaria multiplex TaxID=323545 RepID=A0A7C8MH44_9PEZI|nr:hypothetical protein GQX73_g9124 [Xylaria multiplex]